MTKKKGYKQLLLLTITFTLTGVVMLGMSLLDSPLFQVPAALAASITPIFAAGCTCVIRKRYFTEP